MRSLDRFEKRGIVFGIPLRLRALRQRCAL